MASRFTKTPLIQVQRTLAAQSATKKAEAPPMQVTKLANGLSVGSVAEGNGLTSIGISVKAGSRYESYENAGVSHAVRAAIGLSSTNLTGFGITRNIQQGGSSLNAFADRELVLYHSSFLPDQEHRVTDYLLEAVTSPLFRKWEVPKSVEQLKFHVADLDDATKAVDAFHKAAYRGSGLGNSLFCPEHMIGKHKLADLEAFHQKNFTADRMMLVGLGIRHSQLEDLGKSLQLNTGAGSSLPTKYHGGDAHVDSLGPLAHVVIGAEVLTGPPSVKDCWAVYLLQKILGDGQKVKYGGLTGKLPKALAADGLHVANGVYFGYSDSSLLGAFISTDAASAGENVSKVAAAMRSIAVTDADVKAAKKVAEMEFAEINFNRTMTMDLLGYMQAFHGQDVSEVGGSLGAVTVADVQAIAKKLSNAKFTIGASGNCGNVPYADTL